MKKIATWISATALSPATDGSLIARTSSIETGLAYYVLPWFEPQAPR